MSHITPNIVNQILAARHIVILLTDPNLCIVAATGDRHVLEQLPTSNQVCPPKIATDNHPIQPNNAIIGCNLLTILPEFSGYEKQIKEILAGKETTVHLTWINRTLADGSVRYLDAVLLPQFLENETAADVGTLGEAKDQPAKATSPVAGDSPPIIGLTCVVEDSTDTGNQHQQIVQQRNELHLLKDHITQESNALAIANVELAHLNKTKSRFVSIAAHELRTPLSAIIGYVDLLLENMFGPLNPEQDKFLNIILDSARRLLNITNNLLDVTMIESGNIELLLTPFDLSILIDRAILELKPMFQDRAQTLVTDYAPDLGLAMIDETRVIQILTNLLSNASKYSPEGSQISVSLSLAQEPGFARLGIHDQGVGIPADEQHRLFSRFFRASSAQLVNASGAGLGLHITAHLVELHGGRVWTESTPGQGSTFYVTLPLWA